MYLKNRLAGFVMLSCLFSFASVAESTARDLGSEQSTRLAADAVTRGYVGPAGDLYRLDVPAASVVTLDVMTPAIDGNSIALLWEGAEPLGAAYRSATRWVVEVSRPRTLELRVVARHPGRYKIVSRLTAQPSGAPTKTDPEVVDPEPEPDGFGIGPVTGCGSLGPADDHGDTLSCATPLVIGEPADGTVGNAWGDDVDVFVLDFDRVTFVELDLRGDATLTFESAAGNRLAMTETASGARFLSLSPGRYFARVEGLGVDAAYELRAASRSW